MVSQRENPENGEEKPPSATPQEVAEEEVELQPPLMAPKSTPSRMSFGGGIGKNALVSLVVAMLVFILMGMAGGGSFVTKKDFETNIANMAVIVNDATASVNSAVQSLPDTISSTVNSAISQQTSAINQSISQVSASVSSLSTKMDENTAVLDGKITEIQTQMEDYEARITALETVKEEEEEVEKEKKKDAVKVKTGYGSTFDFPREAEPTGNIVRERTLFFHVDNTLDYDVENVEIELVLHSRGDPINLNNSLCVVSGGWPLQWQKVYVGNGVFVTVGVTPTYGTGLEIEADDDVIVYVTVKLGVVLADNPESDVTFYVEGRVTGYDIVE